LKCTIGGAMQPRELERKRLSLKHLGGGTRWRNACIYDVVQIYEASELCSLSHYNVWFHISL
jgi:hypothetical protein